MTLTLELTPEAEEKLRRKAAQRDQELAEYARSVLLTDADTAPVPPPPLTRAEGGELRARLASFTEDWDRPDMDVYDAL